MGSHDLRPLPCRAPARGRPDRRHRGAPPHLRGRHRRLHGRLHGLHGRSERNGARRRPSAPGRGRGRSHGELTGSAGARVHRPRAVARDRRLGGHPGAVLRGRPGRRRDPRRPARLAGDLRGGRAPLRADAPGVRAAHSRVGRPACPRTGLAGDPARRGRALPPDAGRRAGQRARVGQPGHPRCGGGWGSAPGRVRCGRAAPGGTDARPFVLQGPYLQRGRAARLLHGGRKLRCLRLPGLLPARGPANEPDRDRPDPSPRRRW